MSSIARDLALDTAKTVVPFVVLLLWARARFPPPTPPPPERGPFVRTFGFDLVVGALLAVGYVAWLVGTAGSLGYARDEGFYFQAAETYGRWLDDRQPVTQARADAYFKVNSEHPSFMKLAFAISHRELFVKRKVFREEGTSFRFPGMLAGGLAVGLVYVAAARAFRAARTSLLEARLAALCAALALGLMPRFFYNAHLACFDVPIVLAWFGCGLAWLHAVQRGTVGSIVLVGLLFGVTLDVKHNSWFLPIAAACHLAVIAAHAAWFAGAPSGGTGKTRDRELLATRAVNGFLALVSMAALGPPVLRLLWPWLWWDPWNRFQAYAGFHLRHEYYNMELLGRTYWEPPMPRSYAPLMTLATVPAITLLLAGVGGALVLLALLRPGARFSRRLGRPTIFRGLGFDAVHAPGLFWWIGLTINYAAWLRPSTPIFGGTKHWMTAYPFLALFAGAGALAMLRAIRLARKGPILALQVAATLCVAIAPLVLTARSHPWGLSFYTPIVGGPSGAATLGLNRSFWGYTTGAAVEWLNEKAPRNARVYVHDTAGQSWDMLHKDGRLRKDIRGVWSAAGADFVLYHHEMHMQGQEYQAWGATGTVRPAWIGGIDGVPVIWIYRLERE